MLGCRPSRASTWKPCPVQPGYGEGATPAAIWGDRRVCFCFLLRNTRRVDMSTLGLKWEWEIQKRHRQASLLFFLFSSKVLSVFALNGPCAHWFLPVPSMTPCFKFQGKSQSGTHDFFFAGHDPAPSPISPFMSVSVPTTHSQTLSPQASAPWAPSTNGHSACFITCGIFHNLVHVGCFSHISHMWFLFPELDCRRHERRRMGAHSFLNEAQCCLCSRSSGNIFTLIIKNLRCCPERV